MDNATPNPPQRVLQVFAGLDRGGAEQVVMNWFESIDRSDVSFDFVVNDQAELYAHEQRIQDLGGRVYRVPRPSLLRPWVYISSWWKLIKAHPEWSVIHAHHTSTAIIYITLGRLLGRKGLAHSHIDGRDRSLKGIAKQISRFPLRYLADRRLACSEEAGVWMFGPGRYEVLANAIGVADFRMDITSGRQVREWLGIEDKFVVGHVGRFEEQKNHAFLLDVLRHLSALRSDAILLLVGEGSLKSAVEERASFLGLSDKVMFLGPRSDVGRLMGAMDVFILPSHYEGLGVVLIEAQASGLRCFASDVVPREAEQTELLEFLALSEGAEAWAKAVAASPLRDSESRLCASSTLVGGEYDVRQTVATLTEIYADLLRS